LHARLSHFKWVLHRIFDPQYVAGDPIFALLLALKLNATTRSDLGAIQQFYRYEAGMVRNRPWVKGSAAMIAAPHEQAGMPYVLACFVRDSPEPGIELLVEIIQTPDRLENLRDCNLRASRESTFGLWDARQYRHESLCSRLKYHPDLKIHRA